MKKAYLLMTISSLLFFCLTGCIEDQTEKIKDKAANDKDFVTSITWDNSIKDLGSIEEGQKVEVIYTFTNSGDKPLVIKSVNASCGCTVPERPEEPIMPGKSGTIKAVFDSKGRPGSNHKTLTVNANTTPSPSHVLEFNVNVNMKPQETKS
jgi:hypothetical protein